MFPKFSNRFCFRLFTLQSSKGAIRHSSRKDCGKVVEPKCDPKDPDVCKGREVKDTGRAYVVPREEKSIWEYPDCCANACLDLPARMDELHYKMSDKLVREYSQTWAPCPPLRIKETVICPEPCEAIPLPSRPTRKKGAGNSSAENRQLACPQPKLQGLIGCKDASKRSCPRFELKGCAPPRSPPSCTPDQNILSDCKKEPTPYPCFSECQRPKPDPLNPTELMQSIGKVVRVNTNDLSRKKRYVAFPEGSSVTAAICLTVGMIGNPSRDFLSYAVNFGVAYNLPTAEWARRHRDGFSNNTKALRQRRSRHDFYEKLIVILDSVGFNGMSCVARALCESGKIFESSQSKRGNMVEEIMKTIFSSLYKECQISLLDLALGKYLTSIDQGSSDYKHV
uniref:Uncharacterized protein n=1 Tax=Glossina pallidipes TaxID=7398 RepID=A0A1A9ZCI4_GLOPL